MYFHHFLRIKNILEILKAKNLLFKQSCTYIFLLLYAYMYNGGNGFMAVDKFTERMVLPNSKLHRVL